MIRGILLLKCSLLLWSTSTNAQDSAITQRIAAVFQKVDEQWGNVYFFDSVWTDSKIIKRLYQEYPKTAQVITKFDFRQVDVNFAQLRQRIPPEKLTKLSRLPQDPPIQLSLEDSLYLNKVWQLDSISLYASESDYRQGLANLRLFKDNSVLLESIKRKIDVQVKKVFTLVAVFESDKYCLIVYKVNFHRIDDDVFTELVFK